MHRLDFLHSEAWPELFATRTLQNKVDHLMREAESMKPENGESAASFTHRHARITAQLSLLRWMRDALPKLVEAELKR